MSAQERFNLTIEEAADRLRVSRSTLSGWRCHGGGPRYMKYGRMVLYPLAQIEQWERQRLVSFTTEIRQPNWSKAERPKADSSNTAPQEAPQVSISR